MPESGRCENLLIPPPPSPSRPDLARAGYSEWGAAFGVELGSGDGGSGWRWALRPVSSPAADPFRARGLRWFAGAKGLENIKYEEDLILDSRGSTLSTCRWGPANRAPKALIFLCHGYAMECSISMRGTATQLAKAGFAVYGIDYMGHGKSSGLQGYIPSFDELVNYCSDHFTSICERGKNKKKMRFLLGESMGGAVALLLHKKKPTYWDGAVLVAPMCKIAEEMRPHPMVIKILSKLCKIIPTWKIIPIKDIIDSAIKDLEWREVVRNNPYCYKGKPGLKTGHELLMVSLDIEKNLHQGGDDTVTDPSVSQLLYESASSKDKTFKLYPGMWHALISGEPQGSIDLVFSDIITWLDNRVVTMNAGSEREQKTRHDPSILPLHKTSKQQCEKVC